MTKYNVTISLSSLPLYLWMDLLIQVRFKRSHLHMLQQESRCYCHAASFLFFSFLFLRGKHEVLDVGLLGISKTRKIGIRGLRQFVPNRRGKHYIIMYVGEHVC